MLDKEKYPELYNATEALIEMRMRWLREALHCQMLCELLPEEIKSLHITAADMSCKDLLISIHNEDGTIATLKTLGIQGLKPTVSPFCETNFSTSGEGILSDGTKLVLYVSEIDEPEGCRVEEKIVTRKEYSLVCEKTGESL